MTENKSKLPVPGAHSIPSPDEVNKGKPQVAGGADTSTGAKEQSSAPPGSDAKEDQSSGSTAGTSSDTSTGAKQQSSSPPGSAAAGDISKSTDKASCDKAGGMWDDTGKSCAEKKM